ncbi:hypothetical protein C2845_PM17G15000 [Panicum miliaceum]|uniref:Uncharacterized protein n=1 Tax=Panicum miliaceum TaxID=4540 RepID=A0A3L6Q2F2_PANMI|nr:hypothetical protein C2845_PM17G15000 [Panicum miliaceum]
MAREGPARVKINARKIAKIRGFVQIFIEKAGYEIRFVPEESTKKADPKDQPPKKPEDDDSKE